jgi:hypothetical protein
VTSPWAAGLKPGDELWVTVVECGAPSWRRGRLVEKLPKYRYRVAVDGRELVVHQHDVRSVPYVMKEVS